MFKTIMEEVEKENRFPAYAIKVKNLIKHYPSSNGKDKIIALDDISLNVTRGTIFGLLGPNGAGKSTFINILSNVALKTSGSVDIWGMDLDDDARNIACAIGVVPQELSIDPFFTPRETLKQQAGLYNVKKKDRITNKLLDMFDLTNVDNTPSRKLSGGMKRRLMIAKSMVHKPPILVLDEPTAGVDLSLRKILWNQIKELKELGTTILLTTHYLEEAQELCDNIAIMHKGKLVATDTKENLLQRLDNKNFTVTVDRDLNDVPPNLRPHGWVLKGKRKLFLSKRPSKMPLGQMFLAIQVNGLNIIDIVTKETDLEDVFLDIMGEKNEN